MILIQGVSTEQKGRERKLINEMSAIMAATMVDVSRYGMENPQEVEIIFSILFETTQRESLGKIASICVEACKNIFLMGMESKIAFGRLRFLHYIARRRISAKPSKEMVRKALSTVERKAEKNAQENIFKIVKDSQWERVSKMTDVSIITDSEWELASKMTDIMAWAAERMSCVGIKDFPTVGILLSVMLCITELESFEKVVELYVEACKKVIELEKRDGVNAGRLRLLEYAAGVYASRQAVERIFLQKSYSGK